MLLDRWNTVVSEIATGMGYELVDLELCQSGLVRVFIDLIGVIFCWFVCFVPSIVVVRWRLLIFACAQMGSFRMFTCFMDACFMCFYVILQLSILPL